MIYQTICRKPRGFIPVVCLGCHVQFLRETKLIDHLNQDKECMEAMGGNANAARKIVKSIKNKIAYRKNQTTAIRRVRQSYFSTSGRYGPSFPCIVCHELHWRGNTDKVDLDGIEERFLCTDYIHRNRTLFLKLGKYHCCNMCKRKTDSGDMPKVAAKNNLECPWDNMPGELLKLNEVRVFYVSNNV